MDCTCTAEHDLEKEEVTHEMIDEMICNYKNINYDDANKREREVRHDVMTDVHGFGLQCPKKEVKPVLKANEKLLTEVNTEVSV